MKASYLSVFDYLDPGLIGFAKGWPMPPSSYRPDLGVRAMRSIVERAVRAEELGFDWVSFSEHHSMPLVLQPNVAVLAAAVAQATSRVKLALLGPIAAINNPVRTAEEIAMVDTISNGRVVVLPLRSGGFEYAVYHSSLEESRARTHEAIALIERALTDPEPFGWEGRYFRFRKVAVWPGTVQQPCPRIYESGNSFESAEFAARSRHGLAVSFNPVEYLATVIERYRQEAQRAGWTPQPDDITYRGFCLLTETDAEAEAILDALTNTDAASAAFSPAFGRLQFVGSPESVVQQLRELWDLGVGVADIAFIGHGFEHESVLRSMDVFAAKVLPEIHRFAAAGDDHDTPKPLDGSTQEVTR